MPFSLLFCWKYCCQNPSNKKAFVPRSGFKYRYWSYRFAGNSVDWKKVDDERYQLYIAEKELNKDDSEDESAAPFLSPFFYQQVIIFTIYLCYCYYCRFFLYTSITYFTHQPLFLRFSHQWPFKTAQTQEYYYINKAVNGRCYSFNTSFLTFSLDMHTIIFTIQIV